MNNKQIDLIVTHYNEPWELGKPFFQMLTLQRNANLDDIRVIIVQDGEDGALDWKELLSDYPFAVKVITVEHGGIAKARNAGLKQATSEWVMFCDFDDLFADVNSLSQIIGVLPTDKADILWMDCYREQFVKGSSIFVNCLGDNFTYVYGKLFRRQFLEECNITFPDIPFEFDYVFCDLALNECETSRVMRITTKFTMYMKTIRKYSYTMQRKNISRMVESVFYGDVYLVNEYDKRGCIDEKCVSIAKTIIDTYFILNSTPRVAHYSEIENLFCEFYSENKALFERVSPNELEVIVDASEKHLCNALMSMYNNFLIEAGAPETGMNNVRKWLRRIGNKQHSAPVKPVQDNRAVTYESFGKQKKESTAEEADPEDDIRTELKTEEESPLHHCTSGSEQEIQKKYAAPVKPVVPKETEPDERVVVYTGTRNTYETILSSFKSLMAHSWVDKAYFLIEDDEFPFEIPDIVTVVNVSNQSFFPEDGPNYHCTWSYMCLMRAAFPQLFPQHKKILSLDIDTIIVDDIEELWNADLSEYYIAGVHEKDKKQEDYINFGVVMMNLDLLREDERSEEMITMINNTKLNCPEQDAFNAVCEGNILLLPSKYNFTPFSHLVVTPEKEAIIHYAGIHYWKGFSPAQKYLKMSWDEIYEMQRGVDGDEDE